MKGYQLKQRNHPAAALAEQIDFGQIQQEKEHETVADLLDSLDNKQKWFALGYLSAQLGENKHQ